MNFLDVFGLQVVLEDRTSENAQRIQQSLNQLGVTVQNVEQAVYGSFQRMESIMHSGFQIALWGQRIVNVGQAISGSFAQIGKEVLKVGASFEIQRMKLNQLYGDVAKGESVFQYAIKQALATPFNVEEYVSAIAGLKVSGVDPMKQYMNEKTGQMQDMITFAGDLAGAYGKNMNDAFFSLKEAIAGNDFRSLKHRFDGLSKQVIEASTGMKLATGGAQKDIEQRAEVFAKFIGSRYGGMMNKLGTTMTGLLSRFKENLQVFLMFVADAGFFKTVKKDLEKLITYIEGNQEKLKQFAKVVSDALITLTRPLSKILNIGMKVVEMFVDFSNAHPMIAKMIVAITVATGTFLILAGALTIVSGSFITMVASLATLALNMRMSHGSTKITAMLLQGFGKIMMGLTISMLQFVAVFAIMATIWKYNLGGIRDSIQSFGGDMKEAFKVFRDITSIMNLDEFIFAVEYMTAVGGRTNKIALAFAKVFYVVKGIFDYLSDGKVMEDTVRRLDALGALGFLESFIKFEIAVRSIALGISKYLVGAFNLLKPPVLWVLDKIQLMVDLVAKLFNRKSPTLFGGDGGGDKFTGKLLNANWEKVGFMIGNFVALGLVTTFAKRIMGVFKVLGRLHKMFQTTSALSILGHGNFQHFPAEKPSPTNPMGTKAKTLVRVLNPFNKAQRQGTVLPQMKPLTWRNIFLAKMGQYYTKFSIAQTKTIGLLSRLKPPITKTQVVDMMKKIGRLSNSAWTLAQGKPLSTRIQRGTGGMSQAGEWVRFKRSLSKLNPMTHIRTFRTNTITKANTIRTTQGKAPTSSLTKSGSTMAGSFLSGLFGGVATSLRSSKLASILGRGFMWAFGLLPMLLNPWVLLGLFVVLLGSVFAGSKLGTVIYEGLLNALEWAIAGLIGATVLLADVTMRFIHWVGDINVKVKTAFTKFFMDIGVEFVRFGLVLQNKLDELLAIFVKFAVEFVKDPRKALANLVKDLTNWGADMLKELGTFTSNILKAMGDLGENIVKSFGKGLKRITNPLSTFIDDTKRKTNEVIDYMNKNLGTNIKWRFDVAPKDAPKHQSPPSPKNRDPYNVIKGMSTGGDVRSAGTFRLHEGESVVNDPQMNSFEEGIKRLRTFSNNVNTQNQSKGQTVIHQDTKIDKIEVVLPNVKDANPEDIAEALKDPKVMLVLKQVLSNARNQEDMKTGKRITPNFGVVRV